MSDLKSLGKNWSNFRRPHKVPLFEGTKIIALIGLTPILVVFSQSLRIPLRPLRGKLCESSSLDRIWGAPKGPRAGARAKSVKAQEGLTSENQKSH